MALCGVSGSHHCQRQLLDRVGKQPDYVSPSPWTIWLRTWNNDDVPWVSEKVWKTNLPWRVPAQRLVLPDEGPSQLWVMNRSGSKRFPVIMMSVSAQRDVCAAWKVLHCQTNVYSKSRSLPSFPFKVTDTTICASSIPVIILICSTRSYFAWLSFLHRKWMTWQESVKLWPRLLSVRLKVHQVMTTLMTGSTPPR